jgi:hypothetical protein
MALVLEEKPPAVLANDGCGKEEASSIVDYVDARDLVVDIGLLLQEEGGAAAALLGVLRRLGGAWGGATSIEDVHVSMMSGAMTNLVFRCSLVRGGVEESVVLARVHANRGGGGGDGGGDAHNGDGDGDHHEKTHHATSVDAPPADLFDRAEEFATFAAVSAARLGPRLLLAFKNGRLEEFLLDYVTLSAHDLPDPNVAAAIAAATAGFHVSVVRALMVLLCLLMD